MFVVDDDGIACLFDDGYSVVFAGFFQFGIERQGCQTQINPVTFITKINADSVA